RGARRAQRARPPLRPGRGGRAADPGAGRDGRGADRADAAQGGGQRTLRRGPARARRRLARGPVGVQRRSAGARHRGLAGAGGLGDRPRDRLQPVGFRRRPARADALGRGRAAGAARRRPAAAAQGTRPAPRGGAAAQVAAGRATRRPRLAAAAGTAPAGALATAVPAPVRSAAAAGRGLEPARGTRTLAAARTGAFAVGDQPAGDGGARIFDPAAGGRARGTCGGRRGQRGSRGRTRHQRHVEIESHVEPTHGRLLCGKPTMGRLYKGAVMLENSYPYYLANRPVAANTDLVVRDKYSGEVATRVAQADAAVVDQAIAAAWEARAAMAALPPDARRDVLEHCVRRFGERQEELALALCIEAGKPIRDARGEVTRLIDTFRIAAGEATRIEGETVELQISERTRGYRGLVK